MRWNCLLKKTLICGAFIWQLELNEVKKAKPIIQVRFDLVWFHPIGPQNVEKIPSASCFIRNKGIPYRVYVGRAQWWTFRGTSRATVSTVLVDNFKVFGGKPTCPR